MPGHKWAGRHVRKKFFEKLKKGIDKLTFIPYNINVMRKEKENE